MTGIRLLACGHAFQAKPLELEVPPGGSIRSLIVAARQQGLIDPILVDSRGRVSPGLDLYIVLADPTMTVPAAPINEVLWDRVKPKPGMTLSLILRPGKGDGGGKSPIGILLSIAVIAASFYVGAWVGGLEMAQGFSVLGGKVNLLGAAAGALTSLVGNAIVNSIVPTPKPRISELSGRFSSEATSPSYSLTGASNQANPFGPVSTVMGALRVYGQPVAEPFIETVGDKTYLRQAFDFGYGPLRLSEFRIGNQELGNVADYEIEWREGREGDAALTLYPDLPHTETVSLVCRADQPVTVQSIEADEVALDFSFDGGLTQYSGGWLRSAVKLRVEYRPLGSTGAWTPARTNSAAPQEEQYFDAAYYLAQSPDVAADGYYGSRPWQHYLNHGRAEGRPARWSESDTWEFSGETEKPTIRGGRFTLPARGAYEIRITRQTADSTDATIRNEFRLGAIKSVKAGNPVRRSGRCLVGLRIEAGERFNGVVDELSALAESYLPVWTGSEWTEAITRNHAWQALQVLRGPGNKKPVADSSLDLPMWKALADRNDEAIDGLPRHSYDNVLDTRAPVLQRADDILATCRARLAKIGGKWAPVFDAPRSAPVAFVSPEDSWGFSRKITHVRMPDGLRVRWQDTERRSQETVVYAPGKTADTATLYEVIELEGCRNQALAWREGCYWYSCGQHRRALTTLSMQLRHLAFGLGDLVAVSHPLPRWGGGSAYIAGRTLDGDGRVISLALDKSVSMEAGKDYAIWVRLRDGSSAYERVITTPGDVTTLTPQAPIAALSAGDPDTLPQVDDVLQFGLLGWEHKRLIVKRITRQGRENARIEFVDEAPQVHLAELTAMPAQIAPEGAVPSGSAPGAVRDLVLTERISYRSDEAVSIIEASWRPAEGVAPASYDVYRFIDGVWVYQAPVLQPSWRIQAAAIGESVRLAVVSVSALGRKLDLAASSQAVLTVAGDKSPPGDIRRLTIEETARGTRRLNGEFDRKPTHAGIEFRFHVGNNRDWSSARPMQQAGTLISELPFETELLAEGIYTVMAKAVDRAGNKSVNAAYVIVDLGSRSLDNIIETTDFAALGFLGSVVGGAVDDGEVLATDPGSPGWADGATPGWTDDDAPAWSFDSDIGWSADQAPGWTNDNDPGWTAIYSALSYLDAFDVGASGYLTLAAAGEGALALYYRNRDSLPAWTDDGDPGWTDDAAPGWAVADWVPYSGPIRTGVGRHEVRVDIPSGQVRGRITGLTALLDLDDQIESLEDVAIPLEGIRLPLTKSWYLIRNVVPTVQFDGNGASALRVVDKDPGAGPLVFAINDNNEVVNGLMDILVHGARR